MRKYPWSAKLEPHYSRLRATDNAILEVPDGSHSFSTALWSTCYKDMAGAVLWHYTPIAGLAGILKSREVWLHSLIKRMSQGELTDFAKQFDYSGLLAIGEDGQRIADTFARDLFYLSLTEQEEPAGMWKDFGEVRLRLKIVPVQQRAQLWRMNYLPGGNPIPILKQFAQARFNRHFVPWQVSRNGAFFLDSYHSQEAEVRLLVKRFDQTTDLVVKQSQRHEAVAIPLGKPNSRVSIDLVCIEVETKESLTAVQQLLDAHVPDLNIQCTVCPL
ncbi:hypothetical protein C5F53_06915 [Rhodoferax sp. TS-BS-61-7]|nr:hypothetical protein C5F53_06915 [Rhodoferax sp. TS-BS-61-7]